MATNSNIVVQAQSLWHKHLFSGQNSFQWHAHSLRHLVNFLTRHRCVFEQELYESLGNETTQATSAAEALLQVLQERLCEAKPRINPPESVLIAAAALEFRLRASHLKQFSFEHLNSVWSDVKVRFALSCSASLPLNVPDWICRKEVWESNLDLSKRLIDGTAQFLEFHELAE